MGIFLSPQEATVDEGYIIRWVGDAMEISHFAEGEGAGKVEAGGRKRWAKSAMRIYIFTKNKRAGCGGAY